MPSTEVLSRLADAGIEVKAAASAVDEDAADRALTGKPQKSQSDNGAGDAAQGSAAEPGSKQRPQRSSRQGKRAPGSGGGVRRVVIDSQASRRASTGGPSGAQQQQARRPQRGRGRRRRSLAEVNPEPEEIVTTTTAQIIKVNSGSTVKDVSEYLGVPVPNIIKQLMVMGEMATLTQTLADEAIVILAEEFDKQVEIVHTADEVETQPKVTDAKEDLVPRPPVVTIMGHVDHGKTSLLDAIRETEVTETEAGGITQHIGAYQVHHNDKVITFLDTPGHEAFTAMRARGAQVTDLAVIVIAADDGVKPQTREAIDHAKAAGVPILVAVNKIDKEGAQPERVRTEMTSLGLQPEEWGGETIFVDVSAKTHKNLDDLLESILLVAEVAELKANPNTSASGVVIESKLDPGRGAVVTILVDRGTLKVSDAMVAGAHWGRVRAMHDFIGKKVKQTLPGEPVEILGFDSVPAAGEFVRVVTNDREARHAAQERAHRIKSESLARRAGRKVSLDTIFEQQRDAEVRELNLILKADVSGSVEAFEDEIAKLPQDEVKVTMVTTGVGGITESDVNLAAASKAIVMGFNVRPVGSAKQVAEQQGIEIRTYAVIYRAIEDLRDAMQGMLAPEEVEETLGTVEVRQVFRASKIGNIAGSYVTDGKITRGAKARLVRDGTIVYEGEIRSLRRFNEDVREVSSGYECGIVLKDFMDVKDGDQIEVYETREIERTLA